MGLDKLYRELATNYSTFLFRHDLMDQLFLSVRGPIIVSLESTSKFGVENIKLINDSLCILTKNKIYLK